MTIRTHITVRLGDNLIHLHFLRALAKAHPEHRFEHGAHVAYLGQMLELTHDLPNIELYPVEYLRPGSVDAWKNAGKFWERHPLANDWAGFHLAFFDKLAQDLGLKSPFTKPSDLLWDYPALVKKEPICSPFDFLVVNSRPCSGQLSGYGPEQMDWLIAELAQKYTVFCTAKTRIPGVHCTADHGFSVTAIGTASMFCKGIVMVSTGASWPTFNVHNVESVKVRVILLEHERVEIAPNTVHVESVEGAKRELQEKGYL